MIPLDIRRQADGSFRCFTLRRYTALAHFLDGDLRDDGGGFIEELLVDVAALRRGEKTCAMAGGDSVMVNVDKDGATLQIAFAPKPERVTSEELLDAIVRWFDVTNRKLAEELRTIVGLKPNHLQSDRKFSRPIRWRTSSDAEFPYDADADGGVWRLRLNDFPAEPMYTLIVDDEELEDCNDWPCWWEKDKSHGACADVDRIISQLLRLPEVSDGAIAKLLGARLGPVRSSPPNEYFAGECAAGPFDKVELCVNAARIGTVMLKVRAGVVVSEPDLREISCATPQPPFVFDTPHGPPQPPSGLIFRHPQAEVRLTTASSLLVSMEVQWLISNLSAGGRTVAITVETLEAIRRALLEYLETPTDEDRKFLILNTRHDRAAIHPPPGHIGGWRLHQRGSELIIYYETLRNGGYATADLELLDLDKRESTWRVRALRHEKLPWR